MITVGDSFPLTTVLIVAGAALAVVVAMVLLSVFAKRNKDNSDK